MAVLRGVAVASFAALSAPAARRPAVKRRAASASARRFAATRPTNAVVEERVVAGTRVRVLADGTLVYSFGRSPEAGRPGAPPAPEEASQPPPSAHSQPRVHFLGPPPPQLARLALAQGWAVSCGDAGGGDAAAELSAQGVRVRASPAPPRPPAAGAPPAAVVVAPPALAARHPAALSPAAWAAAATEGTAVCVVAAAHGAPLGAALLAAALRGANGGGDVAAALSARPRGGDATAAKAAAAAAARRAPFRPPRRLVLDAALGNDDLDGIRPAMAVVLNLGEGASAAGGAPASCDAAAVADAERIARRLRPGGALLLCGDDAGAAALLAALAAPSSPEIASETASASGVFPARGDDAEAAPAARALVTFGLGARNDWRAVGCRPNVAGGTDFAVLRGGAPVARVSLRAPGQAAVLAALGALAAAALLAAAEPTASPGGGLDMVSAAAAVASAAAGGPASGADAAADAAADALRRCRGVARSMQRVGCAFAGRGHRRVIAYDHDAPRPEAAAAALAAAAQRHDGAALWAVAAAPGGMSGDAALTDALAAALASGAARVVILPAPGAAPRDAEALAAAVRARGVAAAAAASADDAVSRLAFELTHAPAPGADDAAADEAAPPVVLLTLGPPALAPLGAALLKRLRRAQQH